MKPLEVQTSAFTLIFASSHISQEGSVIPFCRQYSLPTNRNTLILWRTESPITEVFIKFCLTWVCEFTFEFGGMNHKLLSYIQIIKKSAPHCTIEQSSSWLFLTSAFMLSENYICNDFMFPDEDDLCDIRLKIYHAGISGRMYVLNIVTSILWPYLFEPCWISVNIILESKYLLIYKSFISAPLSGASYIG